MPVAPFTVDELLELWRRINPVGYTDPIENEAGGRGLDIPAAAAAVMARVDEAADTSIQAYYLRPHSTQTAPPAAGAARATGSVDISRVAPADAPITLIAGTQVPARQRNARGVWLDGELFELSADAVLAAGDLGPVTASIRAVRAGYQGNVPAGRITGFAERGRASIPNAEVLVGAVDANEVADSGVPDRWAESMVGQYVRFTGAGPNAGTVPRRILSVTQGSPVSVAILDGPALVTGTEPALEVEEFAELGLTVEQPQPTSGGLHGWLDAIGRERGTGRQPVEGDEEYRERLSYLSDTVSPAALRRQIARILTPLGIPFRLLETRDPNGLVGFVWSLDAWDARGLEAGVGLVTGRSSATRFFVVLVGLSGLGEFGAAWGDVSPTPNAWGVMAWGGYPVGYVAALFALFEALERVRGGGIGWRLVIDPGL